MKIKKKIVLIGMMGSGKSTIGALLSKKMNMKFIDVDSKIETIEKQTISQIFKLKGEKYFRAIEVKTILSLLDSREKELVLSLGGGSFLDEKIRKSVKKYKDTNKDPNYKLRNSLWVCISCYPVTY